MNENIIGGIIAGLVSGAIIELWNKAKHDYWVIKFLTMSQPKNKGKIWYFPYKYEKSAMDEAKAIKFKIKHKI